MLQPLSAPLQDVVRFFLNPLPAFQSFLTVRSPSVPGQNTGLPCSATWICEWLSPCLSTGGNYCQCESNYEGVHLPTYLLVKACQQLWLFNTYDGYQQFTWVGHITLTLAPLRLLLSDSASPHGSAYSYLRVLLPTA